MQPLVAVKPFCDLMPPGFLSALLPRHHSRQHARVGLALDTPYMPLAVLVASGHTYKVELVVGGYSELGVTFPIGCSYVVTT